MVLVVACDYVHASYDQNWFLGVVEAVEGHLTTPEQKPAQMRYELNAEEAHDKKETAATVSSRVEGRASGSRRRSRLRVKADS